MGYQKVIFHQNFQKPLKRLRCQLNEKSKLIVSRREKTNQKYSQKPGRNGTHWKRQTPNKFLEEIPRKNAQNSGTPQTSQAHSQLLL